MTPSARLAEIARVSLVTAPTPVDEMARLRAALGGGPRLLIKRDDAIPFGFGGNKIRKLESVLAAALAQGADTLVTCGAVQSNHCRATTAAAARLGLGCHLVINGPPPDRPTGNALLDRLLGATIEYVTGRAERTSAMAAAALRLTAAGRHPFMVPLGASTPLGALGYARAIVELAEQIPAPDVILHASSSGGTQAGLLAGCRLLGWPTRVIGISVDEPAGEIVETVRGIVAGVDELLGVPAGRMPEIVVDDGFVGPGYGEASEGSREAQELAARLEAVFVDQAYTAKAMAGLIGYVRGGRFGAGETVLFWHTGGQVGLFA